MANLSSDACKSSFPKRQSKYATLAKNRDTESVKRRDQFFKKVRQNGEERRWEVRGEQNLRTDFLSRQKQWEEEQARRARELAAGPEDEDIEPRDAPDSSQGPCKVLLKLEERFLTKCIDVDLVEQFLSQEDQELEATISMLDNERQNESAQTAMTDYGSEDEEYDRYFMDIVQQVEQKVAGVVIAAEPQQDQEMDYVMD
ncbi:hypothetical protein MMC32_001014 [Xylographa parallela]|nr:hypothetical protein [Xylographa parallela]